MSDYVFEGPKWSAGPITWSFATTTYPIDQNHFAFSSVISTAYQAAVVQAVQKWASVSGLVFQQVPDTFTSGNAPDIRIGFGTLGAPTITATTHAVGETKITFLPYFSSDVVVRLEDPNEYPLVYANGALTYGGAGGATYYQVALHELGHALGLNHSADPIDVMYPIS